MKKLVMLLLMAIVSYGSLNAAMGYAYFATGCRSMGRIGVCSCSSPTLANDASYYTASGNGLKWNAQEFDNCAFDGWYNDAACTDLNTTSKTVTFNSYKVLYAKFHVVSVVVTPSVASNSTGYGTVSGGGKVNAGSEATITASPGGNYKFKGWSTNADGSGTLVGTVSYTFNTGTSSPTENYYAVFEKKQTNATVSVAYATGSDNTMGTISGGTTVTADTNVNLTASANSGYYFKGWSNSQDGSSILSNSNVASYAVSASNTTYYAVFAAYKTSSISPTGSGSHTVWNTPVSIAGGVDLGLPSGLIWADKNVGASEPGYYGSYFAWGETVAMTSVPSAGTYGFQGHDDMNTLTAAYDAATVNLGNGWRMPTRAEFQELIDHAEWSAGTYRWNVSGNNNTINFPFCGHISTQYPANNTNFGRYWTSDKFSGSGSMKRPYYVDFQSNYTYSIKYDNSDASTNCWVGYSVRPVHDGAAAKVLTIQVKVGDNVVATNTYRCNDGEKVQITASDVNGYTFTNWKDGSTVLGTNATQEFTVTADRTYTANYAISTVTATFNNWNGTQLAQVQVNSGSTPVYSGNTPTKSDDLTNTTVTTYTFTGWDDGNGNDLGNITTNTTYTAQFSSTTTDRTYTIRFYDGETLLETYNNLAYGTNLTAPAGPEPIVSDEQVCTFEDWYEEDGTTQISGTVTKNVDYYAKYNCAAVTKYNITLGDYTNGTVTVAYKVNNNLVTKTVAAGASEAIAEGYDVTITATQERGYHFTGWTIGETGATIQEVENAIRVTGISEDVTVTPNFAGNVKYDLEQTFTEEQCTTGSAYNKTDVLTVTLKDRTFTVGEWSTLSVPFDYTLTDQDDLYGGVYKFSKVLLATENSVSLEFVRTYNIEANEPYMIIPRKNVTEPKFYGVEMVNGAEVTRTTDNQVEFVSALWQQQIYGPNDFYVGANSTLRYARTLGTTLYGNRAFFRKIGTAAHAPRRVTIVLDGVEVEKEIAEDGSLEDVQNVRKYMENGRLVIECNGVRMDATGKKIN